MTSGRFSVLAGAALLCASAAASGQLLSVAGEPSLHSPMNPINTRAVNYLHDDGTIENGVGIGGTSPFDIIWLNRFTVQPGGETINEIQAAFGSPNDPRPYNGLPFTLLVYSDATGGSPSDAVLLASVNDVVSNANTGLLNSYTIPSTLITTSEFFVAVLMRNLPGGNGFVASIDQTVPHVSGVSYAGFTVGAPLNENNLGTLGANLGTIEGFGLAGNWVLRATGVPTPGAVSLLALGGLMVARRRRA
jgi:hypothetical protein